MARLGPPARQIVILVAGAACVAALTIGCRPRAGARDLDGSAHDANLGDATTGRDGGVGQDGGGGDGGTECTASPEARTGTTVYLYDSPGVESVDPIRVGTRITVSVEIAVVSAPPANIGFLHLALRNLDPDLRSFAQDGDPLVVANPFVGRVPLTLAAGATEVTFDATVSSDVATVEVDASLGYASAGSCPVIRSHSLAVLQVLGGIVKGVDCYDLDEARSVQVSPRTPLQSTAQYEQENGRWNDVLIDGLVVGGPQCPGPGVLVHQVTKCFTRATGSTVTLSGNAYGGEPWLVDDIFLVEVLDAGENVVAAFTTYQVGQQATGCCAAPPCTSALSYAPAGPSVSIQNLVQGGGNNGTIAASAFDLTDYLPQDGNPFFLRITALDQGVEGALDRVFLNVDFP